LNKIFWDQREDRKNYEVTFVHRGVPGDLKRIPCEEIIHLEPSGFVHQNGEGEENFIPYHRIREIKDIRDGKVVWLSCRK
jgi:uncharacterized protein (UPF0248 family)